MDERQKSEKEIYKRLSSTCILPGMGELLKQHLKKQKMAPLCKDHTTSQKNDKYMVCNGCGSEFLIDRTPKKGHIKCLTCGKIIKVGVPSKYLRIVCRCGKMLTALKTHAGQKGKCPGCGKSLKVPYTRKGQTRKIIKAGIPSRLYKIHCPCGNILTAPKKYEGRQGQCNRCGRTLTIEQQIFDKQKELKQTQISTPEVKIEQEQSIITHFIGPINFKCECGQAHMAEGERAGEYIKCFRCSQKIKIPFPQIIDYEEEISNISVNNKKEWSIQTPYSEENYFRLINVEKNADPANIKKACRTLQSKIERQNPLFQKIQLAKDTLTKPKQRLYYEIINENLSECWKNLTKTKWLKIHDIALKKYKESIQLEKKQKQKKASILWKKSVKKWLLLFKNNEFWTICEKRGESLFPNKFKSQITAQIKDEVFHELIINVAKQFIDRYRAENNQLREHQLYSIFLPLLIYQMEKEHHNLKIKRMIIDYYFENIKWFAEQELWRKSLKKLFELHDLFPADIEVIQLIEEFYPLIEPFFPVWKRKKLAARLGIDS